jgi:hypothetical protein
MYKNIFYLKKNIIYKWRVKVFILPILFFSILHFEYYAQDGFNSLDPLGTPYGGMNRNPSEMPMEQEWVDKTPNTKSINFPDVYMPEQGSKGSSNQKIPQGKTFKNMSAEEFGKAYEDSLNEIYKNDQDKNEYAKIYSYDPEQTSDPKNYTEVSKDNYTNEQKENGWLGYLGGIGALMIIVIPTYFYYRSLK